MNMDYFAPLETKSADGDSHTDEMKTAFAEYDAAQSKRIDELEKKLDDERQRGDRLETAFRRSPRGSDDEKKGPTLEEKAFDGFLRKGPESLPETERKSLTVGESTAGGYLVTGQFEREVLKNLVEVSPVRQAARVGSMTSTTITMPKRTAKPTAYWVGETEDRTGTQQAYGQVTISAHEAACYIDVSIKLLEDSAIPIGQEIGGDLAEEFARIEGVSFTIGDGINKPHGFLANADVPQTPSGNATLITADALIDLLYSLPEFYRGQSTWMMNGTTLASVRKLKDGQGQYLWQPGIAAGQPSTILGRPVVEAVDMPNIAAGSFPIALGAFKQGYRIYDRMGMSLLRDPYTMATKGLVRFHARRRVGADVVKAEALRKLKIGTSL
jgi:HK97 family phage major capsid protein